MDGYSLDPSLSQAALLPWPGLAAMSHRRLVYLMSQQGGGPATGTPPAPISTQGIHQPLKPPLGFAKGALKNYTIFL